MEHRSGKRRKVTMTVSLHQDGECLGWFSTLDFSTGGLGLKGTSCELKPNSVVRISFESRKRGLAFETNCKALVIHQGNGRIGLMWVDQHGVALNSMLAEVDSIAA